MFRFNEPVVKPEVKKKDPVVNLPVIKPIMSDQDYMLTCRKLFQFADKNLDGLVDILEFKIFYPKVRPWTTFTLNTVHSSWLRMFKVYDQNSNNMITWEEAWTRLKR